MTGSRDRVASSRTSIAMRRLPGRERTEDGRAAGGVAGRVSGRAGDKLVADLVRGAAHEMLAAPRNRITTATVTDSGPKYQRQGQEYRHRSREMSRTDSLPTLSIDAVDVRTAARRIPGSPGYAGSLGRHADVGAVPAHAARRPGRRRGRQPPAARAGGLHPPGLRRASTPGCRSATGCCARSSEIVREEMDAAGAQEVLAPDRAAARAVGAQRPGRGLRRR